MSLSFKVLFVPLVGAIIILFLVDIKAQVAASPLTTGCRQQTNYIRCTVCKFNSMNITCADGGTIQITSALYGRFQPYSEVCHSEFREKLNCNGSVGVAKIMSLCQEKTHCFIPSEPVKHGFTDPCGGIEKYTDINFTCSVQGAAEKPCAETLAHLKSNIEEDPEILENIIQDISQKHLETNGTTYNCEGTHLHIVVTKIDEKTYNSILELGSSHIDFTLQTHNVSRIAAAVFVYKVNATDTAQSQLADAGSIALTQYIAVENTTYVVIIGWDANSFLRSINDTTGNDQLPGNPNFVVSPTSSATVCKKIEEEMKNTSNLLIKKLKPICLFIDKVLKKYSDVGCVTSIDDVTGDVTCKCNHLTIFTVLLAVETITIPDGVKITSYTTESASIFALIATIAILHHFKGTGDRVPVQINLSIALLLLHAFNISHDLAVLHETSCMILTMANQYCLLSLGMWFLVEGIRLLIATSFPYTFRSQDPDKRLKVFVLMGWVVPVFIVGAAAGVGFPYEIYMKPQPLYEQCHKHENQSLPIPKYDRCWLAAGTPISYASVVAPLAFVLFANLMIILKTSHVIFNSRRMRNRGEDPGTEDALRAAKSFFLFFLMLGGTWILAFFTGIGNEISNEVFMYIHSLVNGSQGIVVFLLYCVMDDNIRQKIMQWKRKTGGGSGQQPNNTNPEDNSGAEAPNRQEHEDTRI